MFASLPLTALRAFESASRLLSFKAAAEELSVTPTAISHQVRALEDWLGVALFERLPRQVRLTEGGERLFRSLHGALLEVAQSVDTLRPQRSGSSLTLSTTAAFAALWLVPRLGRFGAGRPAHADIDQRALVQLEALRPWLASVVRKVWRALAESAAGDPRIRRRALRPASGDRRARPGAGEQYSGFAERRQRCAGAVPQRNSSRWRRLQRLVRAGP